MKLLINQESFEKTFLASPRQQLAFQPVEEQSDVKIPFATSLIISLFLPVLGYTRMGFTCVPYDVFVTPQLVLEVGIFFAAHTAGP